MPADEESNVDIDEYFNRVNTLARECAQSDTAPHDMIESRGIGNRDIAECMKTRLELITAPELEKLNAYLEIGLFVFAKKPSERQALFALSFDIQHALDLVSLKMQCAPYEPNQPLFQGALSLLNHIRQRSNDSVDGELLDLSAIRSVSGLSIYKVDGGFSRLTCLLNPGVVNWARARYPNSPTFIRLDPFFFKHQQPRELLTEATLVPANRKWLGDFSLRKGMKDFALYALQDVSPQDDPRGFWEYRMKGVRQLEIRVRRREKDYLTMMIEELSKQDEENSLMVGRCIHLDTRDPVGTPLAAVKVNHLDLAVNVYQGRRRQEHYSQTLKNGKAADASFRTHVFRIEQADFCSVFDFCQLFLRSQLLVDEWIQEVTGGR